LDADEDAVSVSTAFPLATLLPWKLADTPAGNPEAARATAPEPNDFTWTLTTAFPEAIL